MWAWLPLLCGVLNRVDDVLITRAAAQIAGDTFADLALRRRRVVVQQRHCRHDHSRRAEAALKPVLLPEALLQGMQLTLRGKPLDRGDRGAIGLDGEHRARLHAAAIDEHGARAALAGVAADVGAREAQL